MEALGAMAEEARSGGEIKKKGGREEKKGKRENRGKRKLAGEGLAEMMAVASGRGAKRCGEERREGGGGR